MGAAGRERAKALYSLETMTRRTLEVYSQVLEEHGG